MAERGGRVTGRNGRHLRRKLSNRQAPAVYPPFWPKFGPPTVRMAETIPTSVVVCGLPEAGRLHVQQRDGEAATLHDVYATGSLLCALPAQPDEELVTQLPLLVSAPADPSNHSPLGSRACRVCCDSACPMA